MEVGHEIDYCMEGSALSGPVWVLEVLQEYIEVSME